MEIGNWKLETLKKNWQIVTLIILSIVFVFIYSWFPYVSAKEQGLLHYPKNEKEGSEIFNNLSFPSPTEVAQTKVKFASPDATANYFWINWYNTYSKLFYIEPYNLIANDYVAPRSVRSDDGVVRPVSFLGIILIYAWLAKMFGAGIIIYLTPIFAALSVLLFYQIIKKIFDDKIAFLSALMLFILAPYWYYTSRGLFHNVLFVDLVLIGVWCAVIASGEKRSEAQRGNPVSLGMFNAQQISKKDGIATAFVSLTRNYSFAITVLAGVFFGLAIITRTSELVWMVPAIVIIAVYYYKNIHWDKVIIFVCGVVLALLPMFYYNQILYGSYFNFGYSVPTSEAFSNVTVSTTSDSPSAEEGDDSLLAFLPFGFSPKVIVKNFWYYYMAMFWYLFMPACLGGLWFLWNYRYQTKKQQVYFLVFVIASLLLVIFYGSWNIQDNINSESVTIGNSYTRYWLPMYIMSLPLAVMFILKLSEFFKAKHLKNIFVGAFIVLFFVLSAYNTVWSKENGLVAVQKGIQENKFQVTKILSQIEKNSIIITKYSDKFFWPEHRVMVGDFSDNKKNQAIYNLAVKNVPVYYYGFIFPERDMDYLNNRRLLEFALQIKEVDLDVESGLGLYIILKVK